MPTLRAPNIPVTYLPSPDNIIPRNNTLRFWQFFMTYLRNWDEK